MIPDKYKWLEEIGTLPKLLASGLQYIGLKEVPGAKANPIILDMAKGLGVADIYTSDEISWCALFINHLIRITGKPPVDIKGDKYNILRAKWLVNWGLPVAHGDEMLGDVAIFNREGGGHVGLIIAETGSTFIIFGGNQSNSASFTEIAKIRLAGCRRYYAHTPYPASVKKYMVDSSGILSTNEK